MEILVSPKKYLRIFGIFPMSKRNLPSAIRRILPLINFIHVTLIVFCLLLYLFGLVWFAIFEVKNLTSLFMSLFFLSATLMRITLYFLILVEKSKLSELMDDLKAIIRRRCVKPSILCIYTREIDESEIFTESIFKWLMVAAVVLPSLKVIETYYHLYVMHDGIQSYKMLMPITLPFNWRTPCGYFIAICIQGLFLVGGAALVLVIAMAFSAICDILGAFCMDINQNIIELEEIVENSHQNITATDRVRIATQFYGIVEFHATAKQLVDRFSATYSLILTAFFGISTPNICTALINLNSGIGIGNGVDVVRLGVILFFVLLYIILLCMFGQTVTTRFDEINVALWNCSLNKFPLNIQKYLPFILSATHKPVHIEGFMNVKCTREVLQKIISGSFTYFSFLRGMSK